MLKKILNRLIRGTAHMAQPVARNRKERRDGRQLIQMLHSISKLLLFNISL
ncbi:hypothetical protein [Chengkuizengella axinellae]|uniref:Uncharacterized protein n=1 Tax=Chengkuizengella axinellae TaxID=3064388 RepID=A0ABT9J0D5_9BACL|nr:hypothetical protein [Chengkuizengella sp. 2205SS18-9]MDP5275091.1 hypothetical protein [Chengkuizengella sp. 2205SS18-9]